MSKYTEKITCGTQSSISEMKCIESNDISYLIHQKNDLNGIYLNIEGKYFIRHEDILRKNSISTKQSKILCGDDENEIWLTLPLTFPIATLHSVTSQREGIYCESNGGSLCFSPDEASISRLFSTIQGLSDIGAGFFQVVIAKISGVTHENIEVIKKEFERIFNAESLKNNEFVSLRPIGWRKRSLSKVSSTIPIEDDKTTISSVTKTNSFYNAILISENHREGFNGTVVKLGTLSKKFLERIKFIYPSIDIIKVSDLEKDNFFEVTIRVKHMPSYVSSEGEDFDSKEKKSILQNLLEKNHMTSICLGEIRLINPYKTQVDVRIPCGLFRTFASISGHSIVEHSECCMATYIPAPQDRKKKYNKLSYNENCSDETPSSAQFNSTKILDQIQYKLSTPKVLNFVDGNKETSLKTPPPNNFFTSGSNCVSNLSTCDMGYNTMFSSNVGRKSYSCTPTTKASLHKISYTPFSSTEMDSSSWIGIDFNIDSTSIFSFDQEGQSIIPPRISSFNHTGNLRNDENSNNANKLFQSNFFSDNSFPNETAKNIDYSHLEIGKISSNEHQIGFVKAKEFENSEIQESSFENESNLQINQTVDFDSHKLLEFDCPQFLENKDFDIINMLENIFSDNSTTNIDSCRADCNDNYFKVGNTHNCKFIESKANREIFKKQNENFDLWSFELYSHSSASVKQRSNLLQRDHTSEFVPNELNYLNERMLFGQQSLLDS
ncbi:hypothetical protein OJ252_1900 [Cryptosporidium canis]|uniref:Uncharacterized protein n=1 Tax=Cryptosporidium canis TaxID=195482 RepID=A0ABQ8P6Q9_9CRYT|nr:hypothetical protein OJ252_1900 [Cryptosporidium canis]